MELWRELLLSGLQNEGIEVVSDEDILKIIKEESFKALLEIKKILDDEKLTEQDCFNKVEKIISTLCERGIFTDRHDF